MLDRKETHRIANLFTSILVGHNMINNNYSLNLWQRSIDKATISLSDEFNIDLPTLWLAKQNIERNPELRDEDFGENAQKKVEDYHASV